ncbi:MAG TPA: M14 family zinc carboxypeptidase, partial [Vicinamibacterales bacterium]|nr:M14 family zinc carboxypeptidase [Vicinamibacterales bacterium]
MRILRISVLTVIALAAAAGCATKAPPATSPSVPPIPAGFSPQQLAETWDRERVSWPVPPLIRHADVEARLKEVRAAAPEFFQLEEIGTSVEGRSINHIWFGRGPFHVLLWSQMHGDEPTATSALFDVFEQ